MCVWELRRLAIRVAAIAGGGGATLALAAAGGPDGWDGEVPAGARVLEQSAAPPEVPASTPEPAAAAPARERRP